MRKAINIWSFTGKSLSTCMKLAKEAGFDGIEPVLNENGELGLNADDNELAALKSYTQEIGLSIHSLATGLYWKYSFTANDPAERENAVRIAKKQIRTAQKLGADTILVVPGLVKADVSYETAYERALSAVSELAEEAEAAQVHIGLENVWNKFLLSPLEMRDFIDAVNSPFVGAYLDVGNVLCNGYPEQWIRILGSRIKKVHFKDYKADAGIFGFVDLLSGDVNWPEVMRALRETNYDGWVTAEITPAYQHHSDQLIFNTIASMRRIMD